MFTRLPPPAAPLSLQVCIFLVDVAADCRCRVLPFYGPIAVMENGKNLSVRESGRCGGSLRFPGEVCGCVGVCGCVWVCGSSFASGRKMTESLNHKCAYPVEGDLLQRRLLTPPFPLTHSPTHPHTHIHIHTTAPLHHCTTTPPRPYDHPAQSVPIHLVLLAGLSSFFALGYGVSLTAMCLPLTVRFAVIAAACVCITWTPLHPSWLRRDIASLGLQQGVGVITAGERGAVVEGGVNIPSLLDTSSPPPS